MDALLLEVRLSIGAVQGYVAAQEKTTVKIHKNKLEIASKDHVTCGCAFKHFTVQPNSCTGLKYVRNEGVHFRLALGEEELAKQHPELSTDDSQLLRDHVSFYCATCGHCITKAQKFSRVLPLPSENWQEICGNMFCHGDDNILPTSDVLNPKLDDCFTSSTDYVLHSSTLDIKTQCRPYQPTNIYCTRCHSFLGAELPIDQAWKKPHQYTRMFTAWFLKVFSMPQSYKMSINDAKPSNAVTLSRYYVSVNNSSGHVPVEIPKLNNRRWIENWIACHLVQLSKENFCHRFVIKEQGNQSKHYACVWLLCPNTFILCNTYPEPSMASDLCHNFTGQTEDVQSKHVEMYHTMKVLYKSESDKDGKKLLDSWAHDSKVHSVYLRQRLCLLLLLTLMESNASLPPSLQCSNGFKNGYLRYS